MLSLMLLAPSGASLVPLEVPVVPWARVAAPPLEDLAGPGAVSGPWFLGLSTGPGAPGWFWILGLVLEPRLGTGP